MHCIEKLSLYHLISLWWHITLFFTYKNMHSSLHNYVAIKVTHLDILNPTNHIWKNLTFHVVNSWNLHTLCKGLSIPYHPPLKMWIVIWLLRLVTISQEILNQICYNMYSFNLNISTMKHLPFFFHQPKTFNLIISPKQFYFLFLIFLFLNVSFQLSLSSLFFLVHQILNLDMFMWKKCTINKKNYIFLFICKHVHLVLEAFHLGRLAPLHSFSMSI